MKTVFRSLALSLFLVACAVDPDAVLEEPATASEAAELQSPFGAITQSCTNFIWVCEANCPFGGGQNILMATCNGVETRVFEQPCSFEGCI